MIESYHIVTSMDMSVASTCHQLDWAAFAYILVLYEGQLYSVQWNLCKMTPPKHSGGGGVSFIQGIIKYYSMVGLRQMFFVEGIAEFILFRGVL